MELLSIFDFFRDTAKSLFSPLTIFWLLSIFVFIFKFKKKKRIAEMILFFTVVWFILITTPFIPKMLLKRLEDRYPPIHISHNKTDTFVSHDSIVHILVLGSGYETDNRLSFSGQLNCSGLGRLMEGIRLHRIISGSKLVFSGFAGSQPIPQAKISAFASQELGVDSTIISTICEPWNTKTEAEEYFKRFGSTHKLYLITDAAHMPRAVMLFRKAGLNPIPAPANFNIKSNNISNSYQDYFPSSRNILWMEIAIKEYLGMLWAKIGGN